MPRGWFFCFTQKTADEWRIRDWSSDVCSSDLEQLGIDCAPSAIDEPIEFCACGRHQPETVKRGAGRKTRGDLLFELRPVPARDHRHIRNGEQSGEGCGHIFR